MRTPEVPPPATWPGDTVVATLVIERLLGFNLLTLTWLLFPVVVVVVVEVMEVMDGQASLS